MRHVAVKRQEAKKDAREHDGDRVVERLLHRKRQIQMERPVGQKYDQHQGQPSDVRFDQQQSANQRERDRDGVKQYRRPQAPASQFTDQAIQRDVPGPPGIEMRERGRRRLFPNHVVPAREADRHERLDLVPVHNGIRYIGMKVGEALPQIDGRHTRETQGWKEHNQPNQRVSNQPPLPTAM